MPTRNASAVWQGNLREGNGTMELGSGAFKGSYSFGTRFGDDPGTNPEELIGAAEAGCFSMALANNLNSAGFAPKRIETKAVVLLERVEGGMAITTITLTTQAEVEGVDDATFQEQVETTKKTCPVSRALTGVNIVVNATLVS